MALRYAKIAVATIPMLLGFFAVLNNLTAYTETLENVVEPILCMRHVFEDSDQRWRALCHPVLLHGVSLLVISAELMIGLIAASGVWLMYGARGASSITFSESMSRVSLACALGVVVWGIGFFVIIGDWFLAWQGQMKPFVTDGVVYSAMLLVCIVVLHVIPDESPPKDG